MIDKICVPVTIYSTMYKHPFNGAIPKDKIGYCYKIAEQVVRLKRISKGGNR